MTRASACRAVARSAKAGRVGRDVATPPWRSYTHTFDEPGFTFDNVVPGTYKVAGFADGKPIEKTVEIVGPRTDVTLR